MYPWPKQSGRQENNLHIEEVQTIHAFIQPQFWVCLTDGQEIEEQKPMIPEVPIQCSGEVGCWCVTVLAFVAMAN